MGDIISFVGQKGGTGKSTLARAFAVEAAKHDKTVLIADLDEAQRTSLDWGVRRAANGLLPPIQVDQVPPRNSSRARRRSICWSRTHPAGRTPRRCGWRRDRS